MPKTRRRDSFVSFLAITGAAALSGCGEARAPDSARAASPKKAVEAVGNRDVIRFIFAIYYLPEAKADVSRAIDRALTRQTGGPKRVEKLPDKPVANHVQVQLIDAVSEAFPPPDLDSLRYFGRGLDQEQARLLQESKRACVLIFAHPRETAWPSLRSACELVEAVARETGGLIWDDETRLLHTPDAWKETQLAVSPDAIPNVANHVTIHAYNTGDFARGITLGMAKFGLPDVIVEEFSWHSQRPVGNLINAFCQALIEGANYECPGVFDLNLRTLKNDEISKANVDNLKSNATGTARLALEVGAADEGDPANDLIEIQFNRYDGSDVHSRQQSMLSELFGSEDGAVAVQHNARILEASENAKAKLNDLRLAFDAGLAPGELLLVKAPFEAPDNGHEWMWVEVINWSDGEIEGLLQNDPTAIPDLHAGQMVNVQQDDVFDYIRQFPDGRQEGNETGKLIQQLQQ